MAKKILWSGSVTLPAPVEISVNDEIIWSSNTGRLASGEMAGDVIAEKKDVSIKWGIPDKGTAWLAWRDFFLQERICKHSTEIRRKRTC